MNTKNGDTIRALREAEAALKKSLEDQATIRETVMTMVKQFAHDIKNPLTPIMGLTKLMKLGMTPAEKIEPNAEIIHQAAMRILGLCEDMLSQTEAVLDKNAANTEAVDEDKVQNVDATEMIKELTSLYANMAEERDINLSTDISKNFPKLHTVPRDLHRALSNIMSNAMKFTPGGGEIKINADIDEQHDAVILVVRDSGEGIPAEQIPHILKPYKTTVSPHGDKGTGLGLPIVNQMMLEIGGKMEIHSHEHQGTTVTLRFPKSMTC